jgi:hypothetical protein
MALEGPSFLIFSASTLSAATTSITISLFLHHRWFLLHEVMSMVIMVYVTLILKTFEYVHLIPFVSNKCLDLVLAHLTMSGGMTGCPSNHVSVGFGLPLGGFFKKSIIRSRHSITFSSYFPLIYPITLARALG